MEQQSRKGAAHGSTGEGGSYLGTVLRPAHLHSNTLRLTLRPLPIHHRAPGETHTLLIQNVCQGSFIFFPFFLSKMDNGEGQQKSEKSDD